MYAIKLDYNPALFTAFVKYFCEIKLLDSRGVIVDPTQIHQVSPLYIIIDKRRWRTSLYTSFTLDIPIIDLTCDNE